MDRLGSVSRLSNGDSQASVVASSSHPREASQSKPTPLTQPLVSPQYYPIPVPMPMMSMMMGASNLSFSPFDPQYQLAAAAVAAGAAGNPSSYMLNPLMMYPGSWISSPSMSSLNVPMAMPAPAFTSAPHPLVKMALSTGRTPQMHVQQQLQQWQQQFQLQNALTANIGLVNPSVTSFPDLATVTPRPIPPSPAKPHLNFFQASTSPVAEKPSQAISCSPQHNSSNIAQENTVSIIQGGNTSPRTRHASPRPIDPSDCQPLTNNSNAIAEILHSQTERDCNSKTSPLCHPAAMRTGDIGGECETAA